MSGLEGCGNDREKERRAEGYIRELHQMRV